MLRSLVQWTIPFLLLFVGFVLLWPPRVPMSPAEADGGEAEETIAEPLRGSVSPARYEPAEADFAVHFRGLVNPYRLMSTFVLPEDTLTFAASGTQGARAAAAGGTLTETGPARWVWRAPAEPGLYPIRVISPADEDTITLHAFVLVPFDPDQTSIDGYQIGRYQKKRLRNNPIYDAPRGFVRVTEELADVRVTPHFTLGAFAGKQSESFPKYLILKEALLLKLEHLLREVNEAGIPAGTFHVMSGYRTPYYNEKIGNETSYSAHVYGAAADIYIDRDNDLTMDDLDGDGRVTTEEARRLAEIVEATRDEPWYPPFRGGLGLYAPAAHRGPFIHVDVRGEDTRW